MERLIKLIEKRKEIGKHKSYTKGGNYNDYIEYCRMGDLILEEVDRLYEEGGLCKTRAVCKFLDASSSTVQPARLADADNQTT